LIRRSASLTSIENILREHSVAELPATHQLPAVPLTHFRPNRVGFRLPTYSTAICPPSSSDCVVHEKDDIGPKSPRRHQRRLRGRCRIDWEDEEPYGRVLAIDEESFRPVQPNVSRERINLAHLLNLAQWRHPPALDVLGRIN
jgi:hypothetical protein